MIEINNLEKSYGSKKAIDIAQYSIADGDMLGLVGNNGAGKTTLFRLILDLVKADQGTGKTSPAPTSTTASSSTTSRPRNTSTSSAACTG